MFPARSVPETTYFHYSERFYRQKQGWAIGSPVSTVVANLYMEKVENRAFITLMGTGDNTLVKIRTRKVEAFTEHIIAVDNKIKFTR